MAEDWSVFDKCLVEYTADWKTTVSTSVGKALTLNDLQKAVDLLKGKEKSVAYYSIGDEVRITGTDIDGDENTATPTGSVGKITDVTDEDTDGDLTEDGHYYEINANWFYGTKSLEPVTSSAQAPTQRKIEVGDWVRCVVNPQCDSPRGAGWEPDLEFKVTRITPVVTGRDILWGNIKNEYGVFHEFVELVNKSSNNNEGDNNMSEVSSNPVKAILENELDSDTRLLRQIGFEEKDGTVAGNGRDAVIQSIYSERRADFAAKYRKALATEENAAKLANKKA